MSEVLDLLTFASKTRHHADWTTFVFADEFRRFGQMRVRSIEDGLAKILCQLTRIHELACRTNNVDLLAIFEERLAVLPAHD